MTAIYFDRKIDDDSRRDLLYKGDLFVYSANEHSLALIEVARNLIREAFPGLDPTTAQDHYPVEEFAQILSKLKPAFIHHPECKKIIPKMMAHIGCDLDQVYFDVPRMRSSTSNNYLTTGIAYAFHAHRDTWYSAPMCQINWWIPIFDIEAGNAMAFHPEWFDRTTPNNSETYNYQDWNATQRFNAAQHIGKDTRPQPKLQEEIKLDPSVVVVTPPGGMLLFAASHLHSSVPNQSGKTRFSIDFRVVHKGDLIAQRGAPNVDCRCTGSPINDYLQGSTLDHLPDDIQQMYLKNSPIPAPTPRP